MKCLHIQLDGKCSGILLSSVFLPGPQEEADDGRPLLPCKEETQKEEHLLLDANLINIFIENVSFHVLWSPCLLDDLPFS